MAERETPRKKVPLESIALKKQELFVSLAILMQWVILCNIVFLYFGFPKVYLAAVVPCCIILLLKIKFKKPNFHHILKLTYFFSIIFTTLLHLIIYHQQDFSRAFYGLMIYILFPAFWFLMSLCISDAEIFLKNVFWRLRYLIVAASILGLVQYFVSPMLFGLVKEDMSRIFSFAANSTASLGDYFRVSSLWLSPQICGLFLSLYIIGYYTFMEHNLSTFLTLLPCVFCGVLSFNKSFFLNMFLLFLCKIKISFLTKSLLVIAGILCLISVSLDNPDSKAHGRILSIDRIIEEETLEDSRLNIYQKKLSECCFWGNGIGIIQNTAAYNSENVAESFLLQVLYEIGVIPFVLLLLIIFRQYFTSPPKMRLLLFAAYLSMLYVHAFNSIYMALYYSLLFLDFSPKRRQDSKSVDCNPASVMPEDELSEKSRQIVFKDMSENKGKACSVLP